MTYELWCSATVKNESKEVIEQVIITVLMQTETGYTLKQDEIYSDPDYYKPGATINIKSDYGTSYDLKFRKAFCSVKKIRLKG
ncbi:hypothetical protein ACO2I9_18885 [Leptospira interrogans]|uniref:Uncharacterized protein n=2 Tax=Leptospira interrogans TaxID=173 RepID=M6GDK4_LEPIR|nr:hypothetical protein [Leptospira interrogans]EMM81437.1 hypothetical protein LEP1GSC037_0453 [Leptospira interrogans str. 2006001854]UML82775.1 hypothetical protein FH587_02425 [Leptospira interrogans]